MLHLNNGLTIPKEHSETLVNQLHHIKAYPNFRWLLNIAILFHNSGIENKELWKIIEEAYMKRNFLETQEVTAEDQVKLALTMGLSDTTSPELWRSLIVDLIEKEESFNSSQRVILIKALSRPDLMPKFDPDFSENKFKPFLAGLISRTLGHKETMNLKEAVAVLLSADKSGILSERSLQEIEPILFDKAMQISKEHIYGIVKFYSNIKITKERKEFLKKLRHALLVKYDKRITLRDAINFNQINNFMMKNAIISTQEYNDPYYKFILTNQFQIFEYLYLARMRTMNFNDVMNLSYLIQGQLSKHLFKLTPEMVYRTLSFLEFRGDISGTFVDHVINIANKFLKTGAKDDYPNKFFSSLLLIKYNQNLKRSQYFSLIQEISHAITKSYENNLVQEYIIYLSSNPESPKELLNIIGDILKLKLKDLKDSQVLELLSFAPSEVYMKDTQFKEQLEEYLVDNFDYLKQDKLCKIYHVIKDILPEKFNEQIIKRLKNAELDLRDIESLTRNLKSLPKDLKEHIQKCFNKNKQHINISNLDTIFLIVMRVFQDHQDFDKKFIQELMQIISMRNSYLNQKNLNKLIDSYGKISK